MSVTKRTTAAALAATGLVAGLGLGAAGAAQAATTTAHTYCVTGGPRSAPYSGAAIKPADIHLGAHNYIGRARWSSWGETRAVGHGVDVAPGIRWHARIVLSGVLRHHGKRYFERMYIEPRGHQTLVLGLVNGRWSLS